MRADLLRLMKSSVYPTFLRTLGACSVGEPNFFAASVVTILELLTMILHHPSDLYQMYQILPQAMKSQVVENIMLKSVPYSPHLLRNLPLKFTRDVLEQACFICSFSHQGNICNTKKARLHLKVSSFCIWLVFGLSYLCCYLYITVSKTVFIRKLLFELEVLWLRKFCVKTFPLLN